MKRPTNHDFTIAHAWFEYFGAWWAYEELYNLIENDRLKAWRMVQVMVAYAPDVGTMGSVAAGPVEDLLGSLKVQMLKEAETSPRFRFCLGMANGLPGEFETVAERNTPAVLPPVTPIETTPEEIRLMIGYFHLQDTSWATELIDELSRRDPDEALFMLRLLLKISDQTPHLREELFSHAFDLFVRLNFPRYRNELKSLASENEDLRNWWRNKNSPPVKDDSWAAFVKEL